MVAARKKEVTVKVSSIRSSNSRIRPSTSWISIFQVAIGIVVSVTTVFLSWKAQELTAQSQEASSRLKQIEQQLAESRFGFERIRDIYDRTEKYLSSSVQDDSRGRVLVVLIGSLPDADVRSQLLAVVTERAQLSTVAAKAATTLTAKATATATGTLSTTTAPASQASPAATASSAFTGKLRLSLNDDKYTATTLEAFKFTDSNGQSWEVPKGFLFKGDAVPRATWSLVGPPLTSSYTAAAVLLEYQYSIKNRPREEVDRMFYDALIASGVPEATAKSLYTSVSIFGAQRWSNKE